MATYRDYGRAARAARERAAAGAANRPTADPGTRPAPHGMRSPQSMGQMVRAGERVMANSQGGFSTAPGSYKPGFAGKASKAFDFGRKLGERAIMGRQMVGLSKDAYNGARLGNHSAQAVFGLIRGGVRAGFRYYDFAKYGLDRAGLMLQKMGQHQPRVDIPPNYVRTYNCAGGHPATFWSSGAAFTSRACAEGTRYSAVGNVNKSDPRARTIWLWSYDGVYTPSDTFVSAYPVAEYQRPSGAYTGQPFGVSQRSVSTSVKAVPNVGMGTPPFGEPMGWAPPMSAPASMFGSEDLPKAANMPVNQVSTWPAADTQTMTPGSPTITRPRPPIPPPITRPPGKGVKEQKLKAGNLIARLGRLALGVTEGIDALEAIFKALPEDAQKECKKKARERQRQAKREGSQYHALSRKMTPQETAACLYANWEDIDVSDAIWELIKNQIEDMWMGWQFGAVDKALQISGRKVMRTPYEPVPLPDWDDADFWSQVADDLGLQ